MENIIEKIYSELDVDRSKLVLGEDVETFHDRIDFHIEAAKNKCDENALDWRYVAGRLAIYKRYLDFTCDINEPYAESVFIIQEKIDAHYLYGDR